MAGYNMACDATHVRDIPEYVVCVHCAESGSHNQKRTIRAEIERGIAILTSCRRREFVVSILAPKGNSHKEAQNSQKSFLSLSFLCLFVAHFPFLLAANSASMKRMDRKVFRGGYGFTAVAVAVLLIPLSLKPADTLPAQIPDAAYWQMVTGFSEEAGPFRFQYISNEREFAALIPDLKKSTKAGGVYLGVGPEQNFRFVFQL